MNYGLIRDTKRLRASNQRKALKEFGVDKSNIVEVGKNGAKVSTVTDALRPGDQLVLHKASLLAEPKRRTTDKPRATFRAAVKAIKAAGATIYELEQERTCTDDMLDMLFDAIDELSGNNKGRGKPGRPKKFDPSKQELRDAEKIWFDITYDSIDDALKAMGSQWTYKRAWQAFGSRYGK